MLLGFTGIECDTQSSSQQTSRKIQVLCETNYHLQEIGDARVPMRTSERESMNISHENPYAPAISILSIVAAVVLTSCCSFALVTCVLVRVRASHNSACPPPNSVRRDTLAATSAQTSNQNPGEFSAPTSERSPSEYVYDLPDTYDVYASGPRPPHTSTTLALVPTSKSGHRELVIVYNSGSIPPHSDHVVPTTGAEVQRSVPPNTTYEDPSQTPLSVHPQASSLDLNHPGLNANNQVIWSTNAP